ncbi:hypothetical protein TL16_g00753 [Triparma laevis f. inornata]|uniref:Uncharacterized protein n=1 Tax=Triparma laevis f. inornata TaxID=1714386 RepID=A0A9W6Z9A8_9STRA|nr:hypothetical protein TL16_g00753 [Triparma laevis f. inornata]
MSTHRPICMPPLSPSILNKLSLNLQKTYNAISPHPKPSEVNGDDGYEDGSGEEFLKVGDVCRGWKVKRRVGGRVYIAKKMRRSYALILIPHTLPCGTLGLLRYLSSSFSPPSPQSYSSPPLSLPSPLLTTHHSTILLTPLLGPTLSESLRYNSKPFLDLKVVEGVVRDMVETLDVLKRVGVCHGRIGGG